MRYKIRAPSEEVFEELVDLLDNDNVPVRTKSKRRLTLSADDLTPEMVEKTVACGAQVSQDYQYDLDASEETSG